MSERGSFVTEFIYCKQCFEHAKKILLSNDKYLDSAVVKNRPIIAGKIGGIFHGAELTTFEYEILPKLEEVICHELRIAVISDSAGCEFFVATPRRKEINS